MSETRVKFPKKLKPLFNERKRFNILEGGRGGAKSWTVAEFLLIEGLVQPKRILCVREIQKSIRDSVHKLLSDKIRQQNYPYEVTERSIKAKNGTEFFFAGLQDHTVDSIKSFEGVDIVWNEESQTTSKRSLDILIPTIRKEGSYFIFTMNRYEELDPVYDRFCNPIQDNVLHIKINYYDNPFCPQVLIDEAETCKREAYEDYLHIWEGEPLQHGDSCVISLERIKGALTRKADTSGRIEVGVDVARFGDDTTEIYIRKGLQIVKHQTLIKKRTYEIADEIAYLLEEYQDANGNCYDIPIKVDDTGVGGGVTDDLIRRNKYLVVPVNNGEKAVNPDKYTNAINEMWFEFGAIIDTVGLPEDHELSQQLASRRYKFDSSGRRCVEDKGSFKKRYGRSPDKADALLLCFYNPTGNVYFSI